MYDKKIAVIGGGISGITSALTLQLLGFPTTCYARELVPGNGGETGSGDTADTNTETGSGTSGSDDPRFASLYPAASVIPHSIRAGGRMKPLFTATQKVFSRLLAQEFPGVTVHRHYEVFEFPKEQPSYVSLMDQPEAVRADDPALPRREGAEQLHGWSFNCYVAEWPVYIRSLYEAFVSAGGELGEREITRGELNSLQEPVVINCTGIWSPLLFGSPGGASRKAGTPDARRAVIGGHLVSIPGAPVHRDGEGRLLSYNYTPGAEVYADPQGQACDVYFYPRSNGWVLGGSRFRGHLNADGTWEGALPGDTVRLDGVDLPRPILELNRDILRNSWELDPGTFERRTARMGYRYMGEKHDGGLQLSSERGFGRKVIHNYGHGGAGVTLSWGCALAAAIMTRKDAGERYGRGLNEVCLQLVDALRQL